MRRTFILAGGSAVLAALVACATSNDDPSALLPETDAGPAEVPEAAAPTDGGADPDVEGPTISWCSDAGWCATPLPDPDLDVKDIWPFGERAFAIAESETLGTKVLEWTEATESWAYIDDNSQNAYGQGQYAGKIWAPNENEIYFGVAPSFIYRGTRESPASPWTWESTRLEYSGRDFGPGRDPGRASYRKYADYPTDRYPALGVWGTSGDDVYAWYANTIFHRRSEDGGAPTWVAEHVVEDPDNPDDTFFVFAADGTSRDDVWFAVGRGRYNTDTTGMYPCSVVIQRTPDVYRRIVDHRINPAPSGTCQAKPGFVQFRIDVYIPALGGSISVPISNPGWVTSIASPRPGSAVGVMDRTQLGYIGSDGAGSALLNPVDVRSAAMTFNPLLSSIWLHGDTAWLSGWGLVLEAENKPDAWAAGLGLRTAEAFASAGVDGGAAYTISTTVLNGAPLNRPLHQVRGSSNTNLWAVGPRYALHKTTP